MFTEFFTNLSKDDVDIAGGKGASLGEMTQAGVPVPPGFVVLSDAFEQFLKETDLNVEIDSILHSVRHDEMHTVEHASEKIQALILNADMPEDIAESIQESFKELDAKFVAVRSSATAEDSASAAWAGQLDSFLNTTEKDLLEKVKNCWASLFTPRAIFYRFEKELHTTAISVAVVVQKMVESQVSGIAFSVHPVTEDYNQLIIEAGLGLGEAIVSGQITPDSYVVEKDPRRIIDINVATQNKALYKKEGGGNEWSELDESTAKTQVLSEDQIHTLSEIILEVEDHYGFPCDIEWAYEDGEFYIVQSRPITTLKSKSDVSTENKQDRVEYEEHQRDYTLLGNSATFTFLTEKKLTDYFDYQAEPMYLCKKDGLFFHYYATKDKVTRAKNWYQKYSFDELKKQQEQTDRLLKDVKDFYDSDHDDYLTSIKRLYEYYGEILPVSLIITEVPEFNDVDDDFLDICIEIRKASEFVFKEGETLGKKLIKSAEVELELAPGTLEDMTYREFLSFCEDEQLPKDLNERNDFVLVEINKDKDIFHYQRDKLDKIYVPKAELVSEITGTTAFKGNVIGKVKIISNISDASKVEEGDVLVASMTDPRYMSAMKRASAFVTNEGGVTCHAAIVARELKKPCVIGTKFAAQILSDGDSVEVNADDGLVRIVTERSQEYDPDDYVRMFAGMSFAFLFTDIFLNYYEKLGVLSIQNLDIGTWMSFLPKDSENKTLKKGANLYTSKEKFGEFKESFEEYIKDSSVYFEEILDKNDISADEVEKVLLLAAKHFSYYSKTEFFYTDKINQSEMVISVEEFDELKLSGRSHLNKLIFEDEGFVKSLLRKISKQTGVKEDHLRNYTIQEIIDLTKEGSRVKVDTVKDRDTFFVSKDLTLVGESAEELSEKFFASYQEKSDTIKGTSAFSGKVTGIARVLLPDFNDFDKISEAVDEMNQGEILIAETTSPEIIAACKKASAIVTNQGGMLSHAAIVSRELKIPCIVGTDKDVCLNIKNGDEIEVNANNGVIKILDKK